MVISFKKEEEANEIWKNFVYFPKQTNIISVDLTVKNIYSLDSQGALDFGGSEYTPAEKNLIEPTIDDDPKYGWWGLEKGEYLIEYNEILSNTDYFAIVFPHERLLVTGCYHSPFLVNFPNSDNKNVLKSVLMVSTNGVRIKENARISTALTYRI
ncbi:MAG: hypothetical protein ACW964_04080 [Candidatus Hodarchaeales archaeon]|jgi:hypothetical protein